MQTILENINVSDRHDLIAKYSLVLDALALALVLWLCSFDSLNRVDIPTHAIDWDSLEAFWAPREEAGLVNIPRSRYSISVGTYGIPCSARPSLQLIKSHSRFFSLGSS